MYLHRLLQVGGVSHVGLSKVFSTLGVSVGKHGSCRRQLLSDVGVEAFDGLCHIANMQLVDGGMFEWAFLHPCLMLAYMVRNSSHLADVYERALAMHPCTMASPWSIIVAWDEFTPGNVLRGDNKRKVMNLSFSFLQLGHTALTSNWGWFTPVALRSTMISSIRGGWSACLAVFLRVLLSGVNGLSLSGMPLQLNGDRVVLLHGRLTNLLSDGAGLAEGYDWRGHASLKPCFVHYNVMMKARTRPIPSPFGTESKIRVGVWTASVRCTITPTTLIYYFCWELALVVSAAPSCVCAHKHGSRHSALNTCGCTGRFPVTMFLVLAQVLGCAMKDSDLANRRPGFVEISSSDHSQFRRWNACGVAKAVDVLEDTGPPIHPCAMPWYVAVLANLGLNVFITTFDLVNLFVWGPVLL
jgi:hypothetical protein